MTLDQHHRLCRWALTVLAAALTGVLGAQPADAQNLATSLAPVESFASIQNPTERSAALFGEVAKVLTHPRCINCHPDTRRPTQGDDLHAHIPPITSDTSMQASGNPCASCHRTTNSATASAGIRSVPGAEHWGLAPASMAWQGLTIGGICEQVKDPARNGNRSLEQIRVHMSTDHLVAWAWHPGEGRTPAPGSHVEFGKLVAAWVATGAHCPK